VLYFLGSGGGEFEVAGVLDSDTDVFDVMVYLVLGKAQTFI
jgi:hypothetical protein